MSKKQKRQRARRITLEQRVARTLKYVDTLTVGSSLLEDKPGPERGAEIMLLLTNRQLKHIIQYPARFEQKFPQDNLVRLAQGERFDRKLELAKEELNG